MTERKVARFPEAQRQLLAALRQGFAGGGFGALEEAYEGLVSRDTENKKLIVDQLFREFLTSALLPAEAARPEVTDCRRFVTEFAIQVGKAFLPLDVS